MIKTEGIQTAPGSGGYRFDKDHAGEGVIQGEARLANLADDVRAAGNQPDNLAFSEADFTQAAGHFRRRTKLANAYGAAGVHLIQRGKVAF